MTVIALPGNLTDWFAQLAAFEELKLRPRFVRENTLFLIEAGGGAR